MNTCVDQERRQIAGECARRLRVATQTDIVLARHAGRLVGQTIGFLHSDLTLIATVISELGRNILQYAQTGEIEIHRVLKGNLAGIHIIARDHGPGIANVDRVVRGGFSTSGGLALGLAGVRRIMDEFDLQSSPRNGTTVSVIKWKV
ncbi:MAG: anti-sigma regulatory factor [Gammaproteobacteria bacterium]|jgi:serine/threonine-protein kinase RsbT